MSYSVSSRLPVLHGWIQRAKCLAAGIILPATIAMAAAFVADRLSGPVMLWALGLGIFIGSIGRHTGDEAELDFAMPLILRLGVALLGARITLGDIMGLGAETVMIVIVSITCLFVISLFAARLCGLNRNFAIIASAATSICGVSAAVAVSGVLTRYPNAERDTAMICIVITALSTIAMIVYPVLALLFHLDSRSSGIFLGGTIHDVAQVVGAGYMMSVDIGDTAIATKLLRIAFLAPVMMATIVFVAGRISNTDMISMPWYSCFKLPWFLLLFLLTVIVHSIGGVPEVFFLTAGVFSQACLVVAIAGLGLKLNFNMFFSYSFKPLAFLMCQTIGFAGIVLGLIYLTPLG